MTAYIRTRRTELTAREVEILVLVAQGRTNAMIARELGVHEETVKRHLREIRFVLGANDRAHAVHIGWQRGYLGGTPTSKRAREDAR